MTHGLSPAGALCQFPVLALSRELYIYQMWDFTNDYGFWNGAGNLVGGREGVASGGQRGGGGGGQCHHMCSQSRL
jgi:hypothetical protein